MDKKLREQLEFRKYMLEDPSKKYDSQDFMEDWKRYQKSVEEDYHLGLIGDGVYANCKKVLMEYMSILFWEGELV